jgi:hypothetical protein
MKCAELSKSPYVGSWGQVNLDEAIVDVDLEWLRYGEVMFSKQLLEPNIELVTLFFNCSKIFLLHLILVLISNLGDYRS